MKKAQLTGIMGLSLLAVSTAVAQQPQPQPGAPAGPSVTESSRALPKGTNLKLKLQDQISSQSNKPGDVIKATIDGNVKDGSGAVIFSEGSQAELEVVNTGAGLGLALKSVMAVGQTYRLKTNPDYTSSASVSGSANVGGGGVSVSGGGNMGAEAQRDTAAVSGGVGVSAQGGNDPQAGISVQGGTGAGAQAGAGADAQGSSKVWNIFKQQNGLGVVDGVKQPPVGGDFVIPPGTTVKFEFEEPVTVTTG